MIELAEEYPKENKILDIYMKNASVGTVVVEVNSQVTSMQICEYLNTNYCLELIDYAELKDGIIHFLREVGQRQRREQKQICIYHFPTDSETIDVIKSLNISRELLRNLHRIVLVMPTLLVNQIKEYEPNLKDYIGLFLDYNRKVRMPFEPVFDVPFQKKFTKNEQQMLKVEYLSLDGENQIEEKLNQFFRYINQFHNRKLSKYECFDTLLPAYKKMLVEVHDHNWQQNSDYIQAVKDIMYQTAVVLAVQRYYDTAKEIFEMMMDVVGRRKERVNIYILQGLEGIAYCEYGAEEYLKAEESILTAVNTLRDMKTQNEAWICRLYSNYAACLMKMREYEKAKSCLAECLDILEENQLLTAERQMRVRTNLMICNMELDSNPNQYAKSWAQFMDDIASIYGVESINYANCLLLDSWYKGILMGMNGDSIEETQIALEINRKQLQENSYTLAINYDVLEKLFHQAGDQERETEACNKKKNILQNYQ